MHLPKIVSLLSLMLIAACAPQPVALATPAPALLPSLVIPPIRTATILVTPTSTAISTVTATPTRTATPTGSLDIDFPSPDGTMRLLSWDYRMYDIIDAEGNVIRSFSKDTRPENVDPSIILFDTLFDPLSWSVNREALFLAARRTEDNGSTKFYGNAFVDANGVYRFDLKTGKLTEILPEMVRGYYATAISPDASQLIYANQTETPVKMILLDLTTMQENTMFVAEENIMEIGSFGWSPDIQQIIFSTMQIEPDTKNGDRRIYNIFLLDVRSIEITQIVKNIDFSIHFNKWIEPNLVRYRDTYTTYWLLDLTSRELSEIKIPSP